MDVDIFTGYHCGGRLTFWFLICTCQKKTLFSFQFIRKFESDNICSSLNGFNGHVCADTTKY